MNFQDFLEFVPQFVAVALPGVVAQQKMIPLERIEGLKNINFEEKKPRNAAVMMLIYPKEGKTHLVLMVRNSYNGVHSAQISFPGGKFETEDVVFENTALRETFEEIGVLPNKIQVLRSFTELYIAPSNFMVYPFLGICTEEIAFVADPKEVASIIELPLSVFLNDDLLFEAPIATSYAKSVIVPAFKIGDHIVWGATAMMLSELKEVLLAGFKT